MTTGSAGRTTLLLTEQLVDAVIQAAIPVSSQPCGRTVRCWSGWCVTWPVRRGSCSSWTSAPVSLPREQHPRGVAQSVTPNARVVYTEQRPGRACTRCRALLTSAVQRASRPTLTRTYVIPGPILDQAADTLDFSRPLAVMLMGVMHLVGDADDPAGILASLKEGYAARQLPSNCRTRLPTLTRRTRWPTRSSCSPEPDAGRAGDIPPCRDEGGRGSSKASEMVEPGLVRAPEWRPDTSVEAQAPAALWAGLGRKV